MGTKLENNSTNEVINTKRKIQEMQIWMLTDIDTAQHT